MHKKPSMGFQTGTPVKPTSVVKRDAKSGQFITQIKPSENVMETAGKRLSVHEARQRMLKQLDASFKRLA